MKSIDILLYPALFLSAAIAWSGCANQAEEPQQAARVVVKTAPVTIKEIAFPVQTSGQLASKQESKLSFKISGIVERLYIDEGQKVKKGQLMASLNLAEIKARVLQARSAYEKTQRDLQRIQRLFADSVVTLEQRQNAETAVEVARSDLQIAEFNLKHARIFSPVNGRVLKRFVEENELVNAGHPVFAVGSTAQDWIVRAGVSDRDLLRLQLGDSAEVRFDVYPNRPFTARVTEIVEAIDPRSGTFEVELTLEDNAERLASGFVAGVEIHPSIRQQLALIPIEALVEGHRNKGVVFTPAENGKIAKKLPVTIGRILDSGIAVSEGLENVSTVITEGSAYLTDSAAIQIIQ